MRRFKQSVSLVRLIGAGLLFLSPMSVAEEGSLTIVTWGGAYERSQKAAYFDVFEEKTGIKINTVQYNGGIDALQKQVELGKQNWDLIDLVMSDNLAACDLGLLEPFDHSSLPDALDGASAEFDFYPRSLTRCGVPQVIYATVLAFDRRAFPGIKPSKVADLFDLKRFPGKRALQKEPIAVLEWALLAKGVPKQEVYNLLSTDRGIKLAFKQLDRIKKNIVWWRDGAEPARLLVEGKVVMASGYNGRFFDATINNSHSIQIIWDGQIYDYSTWGIPLGAHQSEQARAFVRFATRTEQLANQTKYISYGPARNSSNAHIWNHEATGIDIRPHLPTYQPNFTQGLGKDHEWYANTRQRLGKRFERWLNE